MAPEDVEKERKRRLDSAAAVRLEIEEALTAPSAGNGAAVSTTSSASGGRPAWMVATVSVLAAVMLAIPALWNLRERPPPDRRLETRVDIVTPATNDPVSFALSPDGRQLVFVASGDGASRLWVRPLDKTTAQPLSGTDGARYPFWSPDSHPSGSLPTTS